MAVLCIHCGKQVLHIPRSSQRGSRDIKFGGQKQANFACAHAITDATAGELRSRLKKVAMPPFSKSGGGHWPPPFSAPLLVMFIRGSL